MRRLRMMWLGTVLTLAVGAAPLAAVPGAAVERQPGGREDVLQGLPSANVSPPAPSETDRQAAAAQRVAARATAARAGGPAEGQGAPAPGRARTRAGEYWGLPHIIADNSDTAPMRYRARDIRHLKLDKGTRKTLPGLHLAGQRVLRGNLPEVGRISLTRTEDGLTVSVPVRSHSALRGRSPSAAREDLAVRVHVTDKKGRTLVDRTVWATLPDGVRHHSTRHTFTLTDQQARKIAQLRPALRDKFVTVQVVHVIDVDGRKYGGRWTADHTKSFGITLGQSRAATQDTGQGVGLTVANLDIISNGLSMWVNTTITPNTCVETSTGGMTALGVSGMPFGATAEGYVQQDTGSALVSLAEDGADVADKAVAHLAEDVVVSTVATFVGVILTVLDIVKLVKGLGVPTCKNTAGAFTMTATDAYGNATQQAYGLSEFFANGSGPDSGGCLSEECGAGGMADASTAATATGVPDFLKMEIENDGAWLNPVLAVENNYIEETYMGSASPGTSRMWPQGSDMGLAFQVSSHGTGEVAYDWGKDNAYPLIELDVTADGDCSSVFGGYWFNSGYADRLADNWAAQAPYDGCSQENPASYLDPSDWGTVSISTTADGTQNPGSVVAGTPLYAQTTLNQPVEWVDWSYQWLSFYCTTASTCTEPTPIVPVGENPNWNSGFSQYNSSFTPTSNLTGNWVQVAAYPSSVGGAMPGAPLYSTPIYVGTSSFVYVDANPLGPEYGNTLKLTSPLSVAYPEAGNSLEARFPNNWANLPHDLGTVTAVSNSWYGCRKFAFKPTVGGSSVCADFTGQDLLLANSDTYEIPYQSIYPGVVFVQTITVTGTDGNFDFVGTSNAQAVATLPVVEGTPTLHVVPNADGSYTGKITQDPTVYNAASTSYQWFENVTYCTWGAQAGVDCGNDSWLDYLTGPTTLSWTPEFSSGAAEGYFSEIFAQFVAESDRGGFTVTSNSNTWNVEDMPNIMVPSGGPIVTYATNADQQTASLTAYAGTWSQPFYGPATTYLWEYTDPNTGEAVAQTTPDYGGSSELPSAPAGAEVEMTATVYNRAGQPLGSQSMTLTLPTKLTIPMVPKQFINAENWCTSFECIKVDVWVAKYCVETDLGIRPGVCQYRLPNMPNRPVGNVPDVSVPTRSGANQMPQADRTR